jgi:hypothetical protein
MRKYFVAFAVIFALAIYISVQDKRVPAARARENHAQEDVSDTQQDTPGWYGFFRWPNGTTAWAIILTLLAIAEQTTQTARAAQATEAAVTTADKTFSLQENTAKRQLRAYMVVKNARLFLHPDGTVEPTFELDNCGQTPAYDLQGAHYCRFGSYPVEDVKTPPEGLRKSTSVIGAGRQFYGLGEVINYRNMGLVGLLNQLGRPDFVCCVNGYYTYRDIFKEEHYLKFQVIVGGPAGIRQDTNEKGQVFACFCNDSTGNESD